MLSACDSEPLSYGIALAVQFSGQLRPSGPSWSVVGLTAAVTVHHNATHIGTFTGCVT